MSVMLKLCNFYYYKNTEYFKNEGLGMEFIASDNENEELTKEEVRNLDLKDLSDFEGKAYHKVIKLKCIQRYDINTEEYEIIGYYEE